MKFTSAFTFVLAAVATSVSAAPSETNADRLARGLPPLPPTRRGSAVWGAKRSSPSSTPGQCNTGQVNCCNSVSSSSDSGISGLLGLLGIVGLGPNVPIGLNCSPLSVIGVGGNTCSQTPVCCENNSFNGIIAIGCVSLNL